MTSACRTVATGMLEFGEEQGGPTRPGATLAPPTQESRRRRRRDCGSAQEGGADEVSRCFRNADDATFGAWAESLFGSSLFLEYHPVVVQELSLEADLVGAHAGGERKPEVGAGQPAGQQ